MIGSGNHMMEGYIDPVWMRSTSEHGRALQTQVLLLLLCVLLFGFTKKRLLEDLKPSWSQVSPSWLEPQLFDVQKM
jgi:hypothetical protein